MEDDPDEEEMDDVNLDNERECHWRIVFEDNDGGVDDENALLYAKMWDVYVDEKERLVKGGYSLAVVGHDGRKVLWEVVNDHTVEYPTDHEEIGLWGFDFNLFNEDEEGFVRKGSSEFPYLIMLIKIRPGNWKTLLKRMNQKVDEDNGEALGKVNVRYQKVCRFSNNEFRKTIGCLVSAPIFGLGRLRLWDKEEYIKISGNKRKRSSILIKVYLYKVCLSKIIYCLLFYFKTIIIIPFFPRQISGISLTR